MAQGVDDLHGGEVRFLGRVEVDKVSAAEPSGKGRLDNQAGETLSSTLKTPHWEQACPQGPRKLPP